MLSRKSKHVICFCFCNWLVSPQDAVPYILRVRESRLADFNDIHGFCFLNLVGFLGGRKWFTIDYQLFGVQKWIVYIISLPMLPTYSIHGKTLSKGRKGKSHTKYQPHLFHNSLDWDNPHLVFYSVAIQKYHLSKKWQLTTYSCFSEW